MSRHQHVSIEWVCNHSRNSQLALLNSYIDIALTYERDQEIVAASEGWSSTAGCIFHDHFCLAGPLSDPANVRSATSLNEAFTRIAQSASSFHNRADGSATMWKERSIWSLCQLEPWSQTTEPPFTWYQTSHSTPPGALILADIANAYLLIDRSTLFRQTVLETIHNTTVFFEPTTSDSILMNSCYALISPHAPADRTTTVQDFLQYLFSEKGQHVIQTFGSKDTGGYPLFAAAGEGFAASSLRGGRPCDGRWVGASEQ